MSVTSESDYIDYVSARDHVGVRVSVPAKRPHRGYRAIARTIDVSASLAGLLMLLPLFAIVAILIKATSSGPVFFRQARYGQEGKLFLIYKFRSMRPDLCDQSGVCQTVTGDPRLTGIGSFIRATSIDELPQLINVLKGDMALVGPRPHVPGMLAAGKDYEEFDRRYMLRHAVRPGITGLAQVRGLRGSTTSSEAARMRLESDLEYLATRSFGLDMKILLSTVAREFVTGSGS